MANSLKEGLVNTEQVVVTEELTAQKIGSGLLPVYATPMMIALMENTCAKCAQPFLNKDEGTVGISVEIKHTRATPVGQTVVCHCRLVQIDRRRLVFEVKCEDDLGEIGSGKHERFVIDNQKFMQKIEESRKSV